MSFNDGDTTAVQRGPSLKIKREKVNIPALKSFITIEGAGANKTIVQWNDIAQTPGPSGKPLGTIGSATFSVNSLYFISKNITFQNTTPVPAPRAIGKQAVAFRISADTAAFLGLFLVSFSNLEDVDRNCKALVQKGIVRVADIKFLLPYRVKSFSHVIVSQLRTN
ncbi:Pectinesterase, catalytic [Sesbania bispinosa]|nr:Pectinesterase, catalytic [Sesbania bispinosa]